MFTPVFAQGLLNRLIPPEVVLDIAATQTAGAVASGAAVVAVIVTLCAYGLRPRTMYGVVIGLLAGGVLGAVAMGLSAQALGPRPPAPGWLLSTPGRLSLAITTAVGFGTYACVVWLVNRKWGSPEAEGPAALLQVDDSQAAPRDGIRPSPAHIAPPPPGPSR